MSGVEKKGPTPSDRKRLETAGESFGSKKMLTGQSPRQLSTRRAAPGDQADLPIIANDLLTAREYARYRRTSPRTLDRERAEGRGCPFIRLGGRILYRRADIEHYLEAQVRGGARRPEAS